MQGNQRQIAALNKTAGDYTTQLKGLHDKAEELTAQHNNKLAALQAKANADLYAKGIADLEANERQKIEATERGSETRLAVIGAAIKNEDALGLQATAHYRELLTQRVQAEREAEDQSNKLAAEAGKQQAAYELASGELRLAALREHQAIEASLRHVSIQMRMQDELKAENEEFQLKDAALKKEIAALNQGAADYQNKLKELQNKELLLVQQHENSVTSIDERAAKEREANILTSQRRVEQEMSRSLTDLITGHRTFAQMLQQYTQQAAGYLVQLAIASLDANERTKMSDAGKAARDAFKSTMQAFPSPVNLIMAPLAGASAFTSMMAFANGGIVPGVGNFDSVPAMLTPGEAVLPKSLTEGLLTASQGGGFNQPPAPVHMHFAPQIHAIDHIGVDRMLKKHASTFKRHVNDHIRNMNR